MLGDFNQPRLVWKETTNDYAFVDPLHSQINVARQILLDNTSYHGLRQRNLVRNCSNRILDLIFSSDTSMTNGVVKAAQEQIVPIDRYHPALTYSASCLPSLLYEEDYDYDALDFRRGDYDALNRLLEQVDWSEIHRSDDVDSATDCFNRILLNCITQTVPRSRPPRKPVWSNPRLIKLRRKRSKLLKLYSLQRCPILKRQFDEASRIYRGYNRFLYKRYVRRKQDDLRRNPKRFWSFVNSKRKKSGLPTIMHLGEVSANTTQRKCDLFSQHFAGVFVDRIPTPEEALTAANGVPMDAIDFDVFEISNAMVESAIHKLKPSFKPGPDNIPSCVYKSRRASLVPPLQTIFNRSLQLQQFPSVWKSSYMVPVFKKGDKTDVSNYRGITSLSAGSKCLETIVKDVLFSSCRNYISSSQHGFFPKRSVESNLCEIITTCIGAMDNGAQIDAVYTDIKAAFDTVNHHILFDKLSRLGVSNSEQLNRVEKIKDLGVLLDYQLSFKSHYSAIIDKANRQMGFIMKIAKDFNDPTCMAPIGGDVFTAPNNSLDSISSGEVCAPLLCHPSVSVDRGLSMIDRDSYWRND
ncbi:uncharacterized protein LOC129728151 [Wyeomyia smithii]|uniref:uncharacterized protein LOC129728151 n=1 Tax=Wyeomyia smithii TaxID=174621 RepID=UPI002467C541|nr:uncharacterized protein LOC129728151 [Wyeomyia smithii]